MSRMGGKIKYFDFVNGEGYITPDDHGEDLWVDIGEFNARFGDFQTIGVGTQVEFAIKDIGRKKCAVKVTGYNGGPIPLKRRISSSSSERRMGGGGGTRSCEKCTEVNGMCTVCGFYEDEDGGGSSRGSASGSGGGPAV